MYHINNNAFSVARFFVHSVHKLQTIKNGLSLAHPLYTTICCETNMW